MGSLKIPLIFILMFVLVSPTIISLQYNTNAKVEMYDSEN